MKKIYLILFFLLVIPVMVSCSSERIKNAYNIPTEYISASYTVDVNDINVMVGSADYVFVAYIDELIDTVYKHKINKETESGIKEVGSPYTDYKITVIKNIKGELKEKVSIPIQQDGGINQEGDKYILYENDSLLEMGYYYILLAYAQPDGLLLISGANSNVPLKNIKFPKELLLSNKNKIDEILATSEYKRYIGAYHKEVVSDRKRFKSIYDVSNEQ